MLDRQGPGPTPTQREVTTLCIESHKDAVIVN